LLSFKQSATMFKLFNYFSTLLPSSYKALQPVYGSGLHNHFLPTISVLCCFLPIAYIQVLYIFQNVSIVLTFHVPMSSSSFFILLTCLSHPKIICPAFPHRAFLQVVFLCEGAGLMTNPQPGEPGFV